MGQPALQKASGPGPARAGKDPRPAQKKPPAAKKDPVKKDSVAGGEHWRIVTPSGVVHVWLPGGYDAAAAGTVIYVHGYNDSADEAWKNHRLGRQFADSGQNAMFVVPEAPQANEDPVRFAALGKLLKRVRRATKVQLPDGPVVALGHSGAFRTIAGWLDYTRLDHIVLLDALYGDSDRYRAWLETVKGHQYNRLVVVASDTVDKSEAFVKHFKGVVKRKGFPKDYGGFTKNEGRARLLFIRSQYEHMKLVTGGKALPLLLHLSPLQHL